MCNPPNHPTPFLHPHLRNPYELPPPIKKYFGEEKFDLRKLYRDAGLNFMPEIVEGMLVLLWNWALFSMTIIESGHEELEEVITIIDHRERKRRSECQT